MNEPCWISSQQSKSDGYVQVGIKGKLVYLHRLMYETFNGKIPKGLVLDHLCKERSCCNPNHLEPVTQKINTIRGNTGLHNKIKTHCPAGHEYTIENILYRKNGRDCRVCHRIRGRKYMRNKRLNKKIGCVI